MPFQKTLEQYAERAAYRIAPVLNSVDVAGRDRDDYRQLFRLKAWEARNQFQKLPDNEKRPTSEPRWAVTAIRNALCSAGREITRLPEMARYEFETESQMDFGFEDRVGTLDLLSRLRQVISSGEWDLLMTYMENGCNAKAAWEAEGKPISRRGFTKRIQKIRARAKKIVLGMLKTVPNFD